MKNILIAGGAGYIGSHTAKMLKEAGYAPVVYDNLSRGHKEAVRGCVFVKGDIGDAKKLARVFKEYKIAAVMHFAALTEVGQSVKSPAQYYDNNVAKMLVLLEAMLAAGVKYFIFSSTAAVFGEPVKKKINEAHPLNPLNPYGRGKAMAESILKDYDAAYGLKSIVLRYFNACGSDESGQIGESHNPESHLIPLIIQTALGRRGPVEVFGADYPTPDGTCVRDYIHVNDLARAHILALERLFKTKQSDDFNLGGGRGFSVKEIIEACKRISGRSIKTISAPRRAGDPAALTADSAKALKILGWRPSYGLDEIISTSLKWELERKY